MHPPALSSRPHAAAALALLLLAGTAAPAVAGSAHQHGVARLEVVADGSSLTVTLDSPLDNLLGFERGPRTAAERAAAQAMAQRLHGGAALWQPTPAAGCTLQDVALASAVIDPALLAPGGRPSATSAAPAPAADAGHADLQAVFRFDCRAPQGLRGLALGGLFQAFPRLRQLDAAVVAPGVQRGARVGAKNPVLAW